MSLYTPFACGRDTGDGDIEPGSEPLVGSHTSWPSPFDAGATRPAFAGLLVDKHKAKLSTMSLCQTAVNRHALPQIVIPRISPPERQHPHTK